MKEIDLAFERKHAELLKELEICKTDRDAKQAQCEHLKSALRSKKQVTFSFYLFDSVHMGESM